MRRRATAHIPRNPAISRAPPPGCRAGFTDKDDGDTLSRPSFEASTPGCEREGRVCTARLAEESPGNTASARTIRNAFRDDTDPPAACPIVALTRMRLEGTGSRTAERSNAGYFWPLPLHVPREIAGSHSQAGASDGQSKVPMGSRQNTMSSFRTSGHSMNSGLDISMTLSRYTNSLREALRHRPLGLRAVRA
jgi:hypothetical protein